MSRPRASARWPPPTGPAACVPAAPCGSADMAEQTGRPRPSRSGQPRSGQPRAGQPRAASPAPQPRSGQPRAGRRAPTRPGAPPTTCCARSRTGTPTPTCCCPPCSAERGLTGRDAAFATELTYGTLRGHGTYDAILAACSDRDDLDPPVRDVLRLGTHQLLATRVGSHAAVATSVDLAKDVCGPRPSGFVNAVLRRVATRDLEAWIEIVAPSRSQDPTGYLAVRHSYPRWIVEAFRDALGDASRRRNRGRPRGRQRQARGRARPDARGPGRPPTASCPQANQPDGRRTASGWPAVTRRPWSPAARRPSRTRPASWPRWP